MLNIADDANGSKQCATSAVQNVSWLWLFATGVNLAWLSGLAAPVIPMAGLLPGFVGSSDSDGGLGPHRTTIEPSTRQFGLPA